MPVCLRTGSVADLAAQALPARAWMAPAELTRLCGMQSTARTAQFIAGRWLARHLLAENFGGHWRNWTLSGGGDGPPEATGPQLAFLSLSHSGDRLACAVSDQPVGLDIERCRPRKGADALLQAITTEAERASLSTPGPGTEPAGQLQALFQMWTLKEAWLKRHGGGLFSTMLGKAVEARPANLADADACTWSERDVVLALCASNLRDMTGGTMPDLRGWRMVPAEPTSLPERPAA
ncbi:4'-phosphopantetheinyl transferase family protein [Cupriavidus basilensis]